MNCEYGWIKFSTKKEKDGCFTCRLTDFPHIAYTNTTDREALISCLEELALRLQFNKE